MRWTGVWVQLPGGERCGLATTLSPQSLPSRDETPPFADAGELASRRALALAERVPCGGSEASLGFDALQAITPLDPDRWVEGNADLGLPRRCQGKRLERVGRFSFVSALRALAASVAVLELDPLPGESPAERAAYILPRSDLIVVTGMALVNRTPKGLLALCPPGSDVALDGPSVPLSEVLFGYGVSLRCDASVEAPAPVTAGIRQAANFVQIHP